LKTQTDSYKYSRRDIRSRKRRNYRGRERKEINSSKNKGRKNSSLDLITPSNISKTNISLGRKLEAERKKKKGKK